MRNSALKSLWILFEFHFDTLLIKKTISLKIVIPPFPLWILFSSWIKPNLNSLFKKCGENSTFTEGHQCRTALFDLEGVLPNRDQPPGDQQIVSQITYDKMFLIVYETYYTVK